MRMHSVNVELPLQPSQHSQISNANALNKYVAETIQAPQAAVPGQCQID